MSGSSWVFNSVTENRGGPIPHGVIEVVAIVVMVGVVGALAWLFRR